MQRLKIEEINQLISQGEVFEAISIDGSFHIKINKYVPYCCMAIHDGSNFRSDIKSKIALDDFQRWYEEDPFTGDFIDSLPITIIAHDSRFEYDLNRNPEAAIYEEAWGQKVWKSKLSPKERHSSLKKHSNFYKVVKTLVGKLNEKFNGCIVYDIHSYNYKRWDREVPLFNVGTENIDIERYRPYVDHWIQELGSISIPNVENQVGENDVFYGRGYNLEFITKNFDNTLVLATEIKKVYCNEDTGEEFPEIISYLKQAFKEVIVSNAQLFSEKETSWKSTITAHLLDKKEDHDLTSLDKKLHKILKGFELLAFVNPVNSASEQKRFIRNKFNELPRFKYSPIKISPFELKQELSKLPTSNISDISIRSMYETVINSYFDKIDLLSSLGTKKFLYNSLRYFGRPSKKDIQNANYLLHLPAIPTEPTRVPYMSTGQALSAFNQALGAYGMTCKIELSNKVISQVMVLNSKKTILIKPDAKFTTKEANALIEHEIGVHMVTTQNSNLQKLKLFNLGLPVNTMTQEGLAILSEYLSGNITLKRLKKLAMRVIVTDMMCSGADFIECFDYLTKDLQVNAEDAYTIVTRIFRGGGFTKDYLYLSGFVKILKLWKNGVSLKPLLIGKTSLEFYDTIQEMINREMINSPNYVTRSFEQPKHTEGGVIYDYIISGLN
ncbi:MAG: flavohemoglobin expression-modulating QEGLA motif protein [bacterium]|nr:flavohemoglobin expression-modulating QEGLA motif protein [bacterium]